MLNPKYIIPFMIVVTLTVMLMPERWHYNYEGRVTKMVVENDTSQYTYSDGSTKDDVKTSVTYYYKDTQGRNMKKYVSNTNTYSHSLDFIEENNNERVYSYRWWTNVYLWIMITFLTCMISFVVVSTKYCGAYYSERKYPCDHCPFACFCHSDEKKKSKNHFTKFFG